MYDGGDGGYTGPGPGYTIVSRGVSMIATCKPSTEHHTYTISRDFMGQQRLDCKTEYQCSTLIG